MKRADSKQYEMNMLKIKRLFTFVDQTYRYNVSDYTHFELVFLEPVNSIFLFITQLSGSESIYLCPLLPVLFPAIATASQ